MPVVINQAIPLGVFLITGAESFRMTQNLLNFVLCMMTCEEMITLGGLASGLQACDGSLLSFYSVQVVD